MYNIQSFIASTETIAKASNPNFSTLHIALGFDDNYAMPAGITITSVINNTLDVNLHFHLFIDQVSESNIEKFKQLAGDRITITTYRINNNFVINPKTLVLHISNASTCIRFIIPELLNSVTDKVIYLDSDTICLKSLVPLANYNIDDYIAGVISDSKDMQEAISKMYSLDSSKYFNAGVLLINTKNWCDAGITEKALNLINDGNVYKFADQDVLNILLEKKTLLLPIKFNTKIKISIDAHQEKNIKPYTVVLHYISQNKPWYKVYQSEIFQHYLQQSPWKDVELPLSGNSSSVRNYAKYLMKKGAYLRSFYFFFIYLKYKLILKK